MSKQSKVHSYSNYKDNVMNPLKWTTISFESLLAVCAFLTNQLWMQIVCVVFMGIILIFYYGFYLYWMLKDPNRLQSEGFNLETAIMSDTKDPHIKLENKKSSIDVPNEL